MSSQARHRNGNGGTIELPEGPYDQARDLERLAAVFRDGADEAAIFYAGRIFEGLASRAVMDLGMAPSGNAFGNLCLVEELNLLTRATAGFAHTVRRNGNAVRHLHRAVDRHDAEVVVACLRWVLEWYRRHFPFGPRDAGESAGMAVLEELPPRPLADVVRRILQHENDGDGLRSLARQLCTPGGLASPDLACLVAEALIGIGAPDAMAAADVLLREAHSQFPGDRRILQLRGLWYSRSGRFDEAFECLRALPEDEESLGILGGAYKRAWWNCPERIDLLKRSHAKYTEGFNRIKPTSTYLGINAAATALLSGNPTKARSTARKVLSLLCDRHDLLVRLAGTSDHGLGYWDQATLAEAELLVGRYGEARRLYREAFDRFPEQNGHHGSTRMQLSALLQALGMKGADGDFLSGMMTPPPITGDTP